MAGLYVYSPFYEEVPERRGLDLDMLQELERRSGCALRSVVESRLRIWDQMRRGVLQLTLSSVITPERRESSSKMSLSMPRQPWPGTSWKNGG